MHSTDRTNLIAMVARRWKKWVRTDAGTAINVHSLFAGNAIKQAKSYGNQMNRMKVKTNLRRKRKANDVKKYLDLLFIDWCSININLW